MAVYTIMATVRYELPQAVGLVWESNCPLSADSHGSHVNAYRKSYPKRCVERICHKVPAADMRTMAQSFMQECFHGSLIWCAEAVDSRISCSFKVISQLWRAYQAHSEICRFPVSEATIAMKMPVRMHWV